MDDVHTRQLLEWLEAGPRSYAETIAAWGSTCPRHTVFEDAQIAGLVAVVGSRVVLTDRARARLVGSPA